MKKTGSSLVLVAVIMVSVIVVVFGASRLTLVQYNQSNRDEDNIFALYAAKAAVEDGLARFRYNRNAETTDSNGKPTTQRFDLTTGSNIGEIDPTVNPIAKTTSYTPTDQYYDMSMGFRGSQIGVFATNGDANTSNNPTLLKDSVLELTGFPTPSPAYYLRYRFEFDSTCADSDKSHQLVQIQQVDQTTPASLKLITVSAPAGASTVIDSISSTRLNNLAINLNTSSIRLRAFGCDVKYALVTSQSSTGDGQASDNNAGPWFDNLNTTIIATGYYGQAKRTLVATVDRSSGQLINVYDFNLYSGTGNIQP